MTKIGGLLATLLAGRTPVALPERAQWVEARLSEGGTVFAVFEALFASDLDLSERVLEGLERQRREKEAREAARLAAEARAAEARRREKRRAAWTVAAVIACIVAITLGFCAPALG